MKELIRRIRENKYLTRNETDFIIKVLEENSSLRKQVNMWQSEHAKRVLELGKLREGIKLTREDIENEIKFWSEPPKAKLLPSVKAVKDGKVNSYKHCLEILDNLTESEMEE